jgi:hypothetical protein
MYRIALVILVAFASCVSQKKIQAEMSSWVGESKHDLIQRWGPPAETTSDGSTGEILVYARRVYYQLGATPVDYWEYRFMYVDRSGTIYNYLFKKNPNPPDRLDLRVMLR